MNIGNWNGPRGGGIKLQGTERIVTLKSAVTKGQKVYVNTLEDTAETALEGTSVNEDSLSSPVGIDVNMGISQVLMSDSTYDYRVCLFEASDDDDPDVCLLRYNRYTKTADVAYNRELVNGMDDGPQIVEKLKDGIAVCYYTDGNNYPDHMLVTVDSNSVNALGGTISMSKMPVNAVYMRDDVQLVLYSDGYFGVVNQHESYSDRLQFPSYQQAPAGNYEAAYKILKANDYIGYGIVTDLTNTYLQRMDTTSGDIVMGESILLGTARGYDGRSDAIEFRDENNDLFFFIGISDYNTYNTYYCVYKVDEATGDLTVHKSWTMLDDAAGATTNSIYTDAWWWGDYVYYITYTPSGRRLFRYTISTGAITNLGSSTFEDNIYATGSSYYGGTNKRMVDKETMLQIIEKSSLLTVRTVKKVSTGNAIAMEDGNVGDTIKVTVI